MAVAGMIMSFRPPQRTIGLTNAPKAVLYEAIEVGSPEIMAVGTAPN